MKELEEPVDQIHQEYLDEKGPTAQHSNFFYRDFLGRDPMFIDLLDWYKTFPKVWGILGWNIYSYHSHLIVTPPGSPAELDDVGLLRWHQDSGRLTKDMKIHPPPRMAFKIVYWLSDCSEPGREISILCPAATFATRSINLPTAPFPKARCLSVASPAMRSSLTGGSGIAATGTSRILRGKGLFIG